MPAIAFDRCGGTENITDEEEEEESTADPAAAVPLAELNPASSGSMSAISVAKLYRDLKPGDTRRGTIGVGDSENTELSDETLLLLSEESFGGIM
mmetsp:Transcript_40616/g.65901  ORF Transcript_40616/g.65901 Transcript_40616/m.65901 type:complete len:95 (-) Transcript_40616:184-468(-)